MYHLKEQQFCNTVSTCTTLRKYQESHFKYFSDYKNVCAEYVHVSTQCFEKVSRPVKLAKFKRVVKCIVKAVRTGSQR